jgi:hypothetical protein
LSATITDITRSAQSWRAASQGDTFEEALSNIREAVELYLETLPTGFSTERINVTSATGH